MRIEVYFKQLREQIESCPIVQLFNVTYEKRSSHEGFVHGDLIFVDNSTLHLREYVDVEVAVERLMYVYQYTDPEQSLVFRYDNTGHHRSISTYPHHKHSGAENNVERSSAPSLENVLDELQNIIQLP